MAHRVDFPRPLPAAQSFKARIELPVLQEWLVGMPWEELPFLDRLPENTRSRTPMLLAKLCATPQMTSWAGGTAYMLEERSPAHVAWSGGPCEIALLRHLVDPAHSMHAYPYIVNSHASCYACAMLARAVGVEGGHEAELMLRSCEARVDLPWIAGLEAQADGARGWGDDVVRGREESFLLDDLRSRTDGGESGTPRGAEGGWRATVQQALCNCCLPSPPPST